MHVIIVADHAHINGGQAKVAIDSAMGLASRGHRVTYFAAVGPVDARLAQARVETICLEQPDIETASSKLAFLKQVTWNTTAERALGDLLAGCDLAQTVAHVHAWPKSLSPSIGAAISSAGVACVYTMHEYFLVCPNGGFYDYQAQQVCTRTPMSLSCVSVNCDARNYARKAARLARHVLLGRSGLPQSMSRIVTISDLQERVSRDYLPPHAARHRINNPIDAVNLGPKSAPGGPFVYIGRLSGEKGVAHLCEAARRAGVTPVIAGDGPLRGELEARYPGATFLGWRSPEQVRELMRSARALVFPSVWYEGQPLTVYEALAMGTPVIVSDACAGREAVVSGETGLWFRSGDADDLARAMRVLADDATALAMSRAAHARYWADPLTLDRHVAAIEELYGAALADRLKPAV